MSLQHFFLNEQVLSDETSAVFALRLSADDAKHAKTLRLAPGEHIAVIDATQDYFECCIESVAEGKLLVRVCRHEGASEPAVQLTLVQGLAKGDKMDTVLRHATELGICRYVPFSCERSVVRLDAKKSAKRQERWRAIAKSAAMQSGQRRLPEVSDVMDLQGLAALLSGFDAVLVCWEEAPQTASLHKALDHVRHATSASPARVAVVVGPEGGLSERECRALLAANAHSSLVALGPSILRTETAGIVAPALVLYELGGVGRCR